MEDPALIQTPIGPRTLGLLLLAAACGGSEPDREPADSPGPGHAFTVEQLTVSRPLEFPAQLYVEHDAVMAARSAGVLDSLHVDIGAEVAAGQLLATIESVDQRLEVEQARVALEQAERTAGRARALRQGDGVTAAELEQAELALRDAGLALRRAERGLELTRIVAPFAGRVTARYVRPRWLVAVGDTLFRVAEAGPLLARVRVPEAAARGIRGGSAVEVVTEAGSTVPGRVATVAPAVDPGSGTREVIVRVGRAAGMMPGSAVTVRLGGEPRQVVAVPREAISADGYALVRAGDRVTMRAVVLGGDLGDGRVEVVSGLQAGEQLARPAR